MYILSAQDVSFSYRDGDREREILRHCSLNLKEGYFYALVGESGSGKTTFLSLLGGLEIAKKGRVLFKGQSIKDMKLSDYLKKHISFIFQEYNLIPYLSALDNVLLAMGIKNDKVLRNEAIQSLYDVGFDDEKIKRRVNRLSGGERQRVAIARAIACDSEIILADEPTGNLDAQSTQNIIELFKGLAHKYHKCVVVVTHSGDVAKSADFAVRLNMEKKHFEAL